MTAAASANLWLLIFLGLLLTRPSSARDDPPDIRLGMMYSGAESPTWAEGVSNLYAARLAIQDIAASTSLRVRLLEFDGNCSRCLQGGRFMSFADILQRVDGVIGPECSHHANKVVSFFAHPFFRGTQYQKPFLTPSATSVESFYPGPEEAHLMAHLVASQTQMQQLSVRVARDFGWQRFGIIHSMQMLPWVNKLEDFMGGGLEATMIQQEGMSHKEMRRQLAVFLDHDINIMFLLAEKPGFLEILCPAAEMGLLSPKHVWFIDTWLWSSILNTIQGCSESQRKAVMEANPFLDVQEYTRSSLQASDTKSGFSAEQISRRVEQSLRDDGLPYSEDAQITWDLLTYDSVWLLTLAIQQSLELCNPRTCPADWARVVMEHMHNITFEGVSGRVGIRDYQAEYPVVKAYYFLNWEEPVELLSYSADKGVELARPINWSDWRNTSQILDHTIKLEVVHVNATEQIDLVLAASIDAVCGLLVTSSLLLLAVNFRFRNQKLIRMTSPALNNLILSGAILILVSVTLSSTLAFSSNERTLLVACRAELVCVSVGFVLGYGALFAKTWRIHKIFTSRGRKANVKVKDSQLLGYILSFCGIDVILLIAWQVFSPLYIESSASSVEVLEHEEDSLLEIQWHSVECATRLPACAYIFFCLKGFMLLYGAFLAYETRQVHIEELNDSKSIGISIYNTIILSSFGLLASLAIHTDLSMRFLMMSAVKMFCVTISLCIIFLPKLLQLARDPAGDHLNVTKSLSAPKPPNDRVLNSRKASSPAVLTIQPSYTSYITTDCLTIPEEHEVIREASEI